MHRRLPGALSPSVLVALGLGLFVVAVGHHLREILALQAVLAPVAALLLDGTPALGVAYAGHRLSRWDVRPADRTAVVMWSLGGAAVFLSVMGGTMVVRLLEARTIAEPTFPLLVAAEVGAIAGLVAGYYNVEARTDARTARTASEAMAFVNDLIRHDLRNDLTVIEGHAQLLATQQSTGDTDDHSARVIQEKAGEALTRIETTRAIAETVGGEPDLEAVDLSGIVADLAENLARASDATVTTEVDEAVRVTANIGLRSVVDNLLENAVEHNDATDPQVTVAVTANATVATLSVRDNGPGIPPERRNALLGRDDPGETGGLTLAQAMVEQYDGTLQIEDNQPRGTVVRVTLPLATATS